MDRITFDSIAPVSKVQFSNSLRECDYRSVLMILPLDKNHYIGHR